MEVSRFKLTSPVRHLVCAAALMILIVGTAVLILQTFAHTLARNADTIQAAEFAAWAAPSDPLTRFRYAAFLDRTFDLNAIPMSLAEYENAVALAPHDFIYWLALGRARERDGDRSAAEAAYRRALELAPSYARTRWALGNNLVRQGKIDDGIEHIRGAVEQDPNFSSPAVTAAMQAFDADVARVSAALGGSPGTAAELAKYLVIEGRFDEGLAAWGRIPAEAKTTTVREVGIALRSELIKARRFRDAAKVTASIEPDDRGHPTVGTISNGGFETGVEAQGSGPFDWRVGQSYPIYGLSDAQPKEGRYSLLVRFATPARLEFATVSRTVAVAPGGAYDLTLSYRAEINTGAEFRWEVVSADANKRIAVTDPLANSTGWADISLRFTVPADTDGITIRLIRENCNSAGCTVSGSLWFDEFELRRTDGI